VAKLTSLPAGYSELLQDLQSRIRSAQVRAALAVNRELVLLYWSIGKDILARQGTEGWGGRVIDRLAHDLQNEFPGVEGFSPRSLKYMRALAEAWPEESIVQQLIAQLPWGIMFELKDRPRREWYLRAALEHGWSQNVLVHMISGQLHEREGKALTNFKRSLPPPGSDRRLHIPGNTRAARAGARGTAERRGSPGCCQEATFGDRDPAQGAVR
jgi:predicted nuclease of restriction endonuclease-like (RecB) superfamily